MNCKLNNRKRKLEDYVNGNLSEIQMIKFEEHLSVCKDCSSEIDFMIDIMISLRRKEKSSVFKKDIMAVDKSLSNSWVNSKFSKKKIKHKSHYPTKRKPKT